MDFLILTHGAGSNRNAPLLVAVANAFASRGVELLRYDLPFRQQRPHGPPRPADAACDREGLNEEVIKARAKSADHIWLGGHSYGGRQASMLAAAKPGIVDKLLLLSYPLHPPAKPQQLRTAHFPQWKTPALFVHGTKDPFGSIGELRDAIRLIPAPTRLLEINGAGHDLGRKPAEIANQIVEAFLEL